MVDVAELDWRLVKMAATLVGLAGFWVWESVAPAVHHPTRLRHAAHNLLLALGNTLLLALLYASATVALADWSTRHGIGLLNQFALPTGLRLALALVLLDLWLYLWHRANHALPLLWRFHRVHHADTHMDVTTATRFHPGEMVLSGLLRLALVPLLGLQGHELLLHDALVVAVTQMHHANLSFGRFDRWLRWLIITPQVHRVHHSPRRREADANYGVLLSVWDRLAGTFLLLPDPSAGATGLDGFEDPRWQTLPGMLRLGFTTDRPSADGPLEERPSEWSPAPHSNRASGTLTRA